VGLKAIGPLTLRIETERWPMAAPFRIAGHTFEVIDVLVVLRRCPLNHSTSLRRENSKTPRSLRGMSFLVRSRMDAAAR
jgi:hypothetical protein